MRFSTKGAVLWLTLCGLVPPTSSAQRNIQNRGRSDAVPRATGENASPHLDPVASRLLGRDDGLSVIAAALESRVHQGSKADCSHLVHAIYKRAGFPYSYVSSSDLYIGINEFHRVGHPQPGDLVVWPGHVGIVINPAQHSFFSVLRSGLGIDSYDAPYWRERGRPRFYRYILVPATNRPANTRAPRLSPTTLESTESHDDPEPAGAGFDPREGGGSQTESYPVSLERAPGNIPIPRVQLLKSPRPRPAEISRAVLQTFGDTGQTLRGKEIFQLSQPLIIFDQLEVEEVRVKGEQGWAEVRISQLLSLTKGQVKQKKRKERYRWALSRRDRETWEVVLPQDGIYIPRDAAVSILAHQLAVLTEGTGQAVRPVQEKALLARCLSILLEQ